MSNHFDDHGEVKKEITLYLFHGILQESKMIIECLNILGGE